MRDLRLAQVPRLSQYDVAQRLYVTQPTVNRWENGLAEPQESNKRALMDLYHVTIDEIEAAIQATMQARASARKDE